MHRSRFFRLSAIATGVAATFVGGLASVASSADASVAPTAHASAPAPAPAPAAVRASAYQFLLTFDHRESLRAGTRVVDASGHGHSGMVLVEHGGALQARPGLVRRGAQFPSRGRAIVEVPDRSSLDPLRREFVFGAAVRVTQAQSEFGANLLQKGYYNQDGGQWKLQLAAGGVPTCVVFGDRGRLKAVAIHGVANGRWHRVSCARTAAGIMIRVDGKPVATSAGTTGRISNTSPVKVGGKKTSAGNKQFHGRLDNVFLRLLPPVG